SLKNNGLFYLSVFKNDHFFNKEKLEEYFSSNQILEIEDDVIKDNHSPEGEHIHKVIKVLVRK
ncbi:MAG: hypothetical protein ABII95_00160, partial [Patescibacteria group bacterium]